MKHPSIVFLLSLLLGCGNALAGPDYAREQRLADQIVDAIIDGDPVQLKATTEFLGIYTETEAEEAKGTVLLLHGRGFHPDWANAIGPLRVELTTHGWNTLSIQLPVLAKDAKYYDYVPLFDEAAGRIDAALKYIDAQGAKRVVMLAHSCGAHMAMHWLDQRSSFDRAAYIGLGMGATDYKQYMAKPFPLDRIKAPVLDVYGSEDYPAVIKMAPQRLAAIKSAGNPASTQVVIDGADHYYNERNNELVETVAEWLDETFK